MEALALIGDLAIVMLIAGVVGLACRRVGLSVVVGYLVAGIVIGPYTPPFQLVSDLARVDMLAQLGLVFLVFSIVLGLSFARLARLGVSVAIATALGAIFMLNLARVFGAIVDFSTTESLFFAGMVMVSSSAIIAKVLDETNLAHERAGQLALGVTVMEDIVAVVILTLLTPLAEIETAAAQDIPTTVVRLAAFVVALLAFSIVGMPRFLRVLDRVGGAELRTLSLAGTVLAVAWLASAVGYSTALGAFVLGAVVAGTRQRVDIERTFDTMKHIFGGVFFVAVGMLFNLEILFDSYALVLAALAFVVVARPLATSLALVVVGQSLRDAVRAGLTLAPIGEFTFVIAQLGVAAGVLPPTFSAIAVGLALGTSFIGPELARRAEAVADRVVGALPDALERGLSVYGLWLSQLGAGQGGGRSWSIVKPKLPMLAFHLLSTTTVLLVNDSLTRLLLAHVGTTILVENDVEFLAQVLLALVLLAPLSAIWRTVTDIIERAMAELHDGDERRVTRRRALVVMLRVALASAMIVWVVSLMPLGFHGAYSSTMVLVIGGAVVLFFGGRVLRVHRSFERELLAQFRLASNPALTAGLTLPILEASDEWSLEVDEVVLPATADHGGKRIVDLALRKRFSCSIVGIDRQGVVLTNPSADEVLYPHDRILLLGAREQLALAEQFLLSSTSGESQSAAFSDLLTESVAVAPGFVDAGKTLAELSLIERFDVQVCGIARGDARILVPHGTTTVLGGDQLLVLGTHDRIARCRAYFATPRAEQPEGTSAVDA